MLVARAFQNSKNPRVRREAMQLSERDAKRAQRTDELQGFLFANQAVEKFRNQLLRPQEFAFQAWIAGGGRIIRRHLQLRRCASRRVVIRLFAVFVQTVKPATTELASQGIAIIRRNLSDERFQTKGKASQSAQLRKG